MGGGFMFLIIALLSTFVFGQNPMSSIYDGLEIIEDSPPFSTRDPQYNSRYLPTPRYTPSTPSWTQPFNLSLMNTQVPGVMCPLIDARPRLDLVRAAQRLKSQLANAKACTNDTNADQMEKVATEMTASSQKVMELFKQFQNGTLDASQVQSAQADLSVLLQGIDQISQLFKTNSLLNKDCGPDTLKSSHVLAAVGDLIKAASPFVISVAASNPAWAAAVPYIMGAKGAGSMIQALGAIHKRNSVSVDDDNSRAAVLMAVCEYYRLWVKDKTYRNLRPPAPAVAAVTASMSLAEFRASLTANANPGLVQLAQAHEEQSQSLDKKLSELNLIHRTLSETRSSFHKLERQPICDAGREFAKKAPDPDSTAGSLLLIFRELMALQIRPIEVQTALLRTEEHLRVALQKATDLNTCSKYAESYISTLSQLAMLGTRSALALKRSLNHLADQNQELRDLRQLDRMVKLEAASDQLVENAARNGSIDDAEVSSALLLSKRALFGDRDGDFKWGSPIASFKSAGPALAWLNWYDDQSRIHESSFRAAMDQFKSDVFADIIQPKMRMRSPGYDLRRSANVYKYYNVFPAIKVENYPVGSDRHRSICNRLTNLSMKYDATMKHVFAQDFFCSVIEEMMEGDEDSFQDGIKSRCGRRKTTGEKSTKGELSKRMRQLNKTLGAEATNLARKTSELKCLPEPTVP